MTTGTHGWVNSAFHQSQLSAYPIFHWPIMLFIRVIHRISVHINENIYKILDFSTTLLVWSPIKITIGSALNLWSQSSRSLWDFCRVLFRDISRKLLSYSISPIYAIFQIDLFIMHSNLLNRQFVFRESASKFDNLSTKGRVFMQNLWKNDGIIKELFHEYFAHIITEPIAKSSSLHCTKNQ